jgi:DnaJ-domain-containing protein 1
VNDLFAVLRVPRRPWLDSDILKENFLSLSAQSHPDHVHGAPEAQKAIAQDQFTSLNSAYHRLVDPRDRLLHLIELEAGERKFEIQSIPADLMNLFLEVGEVCRKTEGLLAEKETESSPLLKVRLFERAQNQIEELRAAQREVNSSRDHLVSEIKELDTDWEMIDAEKRAPRLRRLNEIASLLNYSKKWNAQLEEKIVRLSF